MESHIGLKSAIQNLSSIDAQSGHINAIVEAPKGSRNKYKFEPDLGLFKLHRVLPEGMVFPFDFGFIPSTKADDGDPIDLLILMDQPAFCGCLVSVRLVGVIEAKQSDSPNGKFERNDRLIAVSTESMLYKHVRKLSDMSPALLDEIERFFIAYNQTWGRRFQVLRRASGQKANKLLQASVKAATAAQKVTPIKNATGKKSRAKQNKNKKQKRAS